MTSSHQFFDREKKTPPFPMLVSVLFVSLAFLITVASFFVYDSERKQDLDRVKAGEITGVGIGADVINHKLDIIARNVRFISGCTALKNALNSATPDALDQLAYEFKTFSGSIGMYDHIRWIDQAGMEKVRVNYAAGQAVVVPRSRLQNKAKRYYFMDTLRLDPGEIYVSPLDLNVDDGEIETPYKPMLRMGVPVFDNSGTKRGIVILNYYGKDMLDEATQSIADHAMVLNRDGYWLRSPAAEDEFGFMFKKSESFSTRFPVAWQRISAADTGQFELESGLWTFSTIYPLSASQHSSSGAMEPYGPSQTTIDRKQYFWKLVSFLPNESLAAVGREHLAITAGSALLLMLISFAGSWRMAQAWIGRLDAETETKQLALRMTMLLESLGEGVFGLDREGRCIFINPAALAMLGYDRSEVIEKDAYQLFHRNTREHANSSESPLHHHARVEGIRTSGEDWFFRKDGTKLPVQLFDTPILQGTEIMGAVVAFQDISERRRAEDAIRRQIEFTEMMISNSSAAIFVLAEGHKVLYWNKACEKLTGVSAPEVVGTDRHWQPFYAEKRPCLADLVLDGQPDGGTALYAIIGPSPLLQGGLHAESWYPNLGGRDRCLTIDSAPIRNSDGKIFAAIETIQDITEHKRAEEAQRESESRYRMLIENSPDAVFLQSEGIFIYLNPAGVKLFGASSSKELLGKQVIDRIHPDFQAMVRERMRMLMEENKPAPVAQETYLRLDGSPVSVEVLAIPFSYFERPAAQVIVRDVTERKQMISELQNVKQRLELAIDSGQLGIWDWDIENDSVVWNDRMLELYGMERDQLSGTGRDWQRHVHPDDRKRVMAAMAAALKGEGDYEVDFRTLHPDGRTIEIKTDGIVIRNAEGRAVRMIGMNRDVTERKQLEEQLRQAQKMEAIGTLAGGVAHDFNNILTAIVGYAHLMQTSMKPRDPMISDIQHILHCASRATQLTRSLLAFSRKQPMTVQLIELNETVLRFEQFLQRLIGEDVDLRIETGRQPLTVMADKSQLEQILMNLATNARDAMPQGGVLTIQTAREEIAEEFVWSRGFGRPGTYARLTVTDNGVGMDDTVRRRVFDPFFTTKEVGKGTGLGLAIVYGIVKQHQGYIDVSSSLCSGSSFHIYLPLVPAGLNHPENVSESERKLPRGSETILVVEDNEEVRGIMQQLLEHFGYAVITATDGDDALDVYQAHRTRVEMVITDVVMPKKNGRELYEELRIRNPAIKMLFMSGYTADVVTLKELTDAGLPFIAKPVDPTTLLLKVREILES